MPSYQATFQYTPEAWAALIKHPEDRTEAVRETVNSLGGKLLDIRYTLGGGHTGYVLVEFPDELAGAAMGALTVASGGVESVDITQVLTAKEMVVALERAKQSQYRPPHHGKSPSG